MFMPSSKQVKKPMRLRLKFLILASLSMVGATCGIRHDTSILSAVQANDLTVIFSGCSELHRDGLILCRSSVGAKPSTQITVTLPGLNCDRESCANFDVVRKDGTIHPLGGIPKGSTKLTFTLEDVLGSPEDISTASGGPYRVLSEAYFKDGGAEYKVLGVGVVYLVVLEPGYVPLGCQSPDAAWTVDLGKDCEAVYTTKYRSQLCGTGCK